MDWDVEMDDAVTPAQNLGATSLTSDPAISAQAPASPPTDDLDSTTPVLVPDKVHIRGLDVLSTDDIKSYVRENFGAVDRVEWIDDTSANLVFASAYNARDALVALSAVQVSDPSQLPILECLPAKPLSSKPEVRLQVRFAVMSDKKQSGAASRSRFYLLHPEHDPEERRRGTHDNRSGYRYRDYGDYPRGGSRRNGRRELDEEVGMVFNASFYDDDEAAIASRHVRPDRHGRSRSRDSGPRLSHAVSGTRSDHIRELFPGRQEPGARDKGNEKSRNRSASPRWDRDGDRSMLEDMPSASSARNRTRAMGIKNDIAAENSSKELFPSKAISASQRQLSQLQVAVETTSLLNEQERAEPRADEHMDGQGPGATSIHIRGIAKAPSSGSGYSIKGAASTDVRELFPSKFAGNAGKELFAEKIEGRGRRRQRAEDLFY